MELDVPILLLCQLNKDGETRESKALEMDATAMWRIEEREESAAERQIAIPWQRNGESGIVFTVAFLGSIARVENLQPGHGERVGRNHGEYAIAFEAKMAPLVNKRSPTG